MPELIRLTIPPSLCLSPPLRSALALSSIPTTSAEDGLYSGAVFQLQLNLFREGHYN